jgi:hypothetical protein
MQQSIFPIKIVDELPANTHSASLRLVGISDAGVKYAIKTLGDGDWIPITEWFCYLVCRAVGIATPAFDILQMLDGSKAFGYKWEPPSTFICDITRDDQSELMNKLLKVHSGSFSSMLALDFFLPNPDRNFFNMMFKHENNAYIPLAFDWDKVHSVKNTFALTTLNRETATYRCLKNIERFSQRLNKTLLSNAHKNSAFSKISQIYNQQIQVIFDSAPPEWKANINVADIVSWWTQTNLQQRIDTAKEMMS